MCPVVLLILPVFGGCFTNTVLELLSWSFPSLCPQEAVPLKYSPLRAPSELHCGHSNELGYHKHQVVGYVFLRQSSL